MGFGGVFILVMDVRCYLNLRRLLHTRTSTNARDGRKFTLEKWSEGREQNSDCLIFRVDNMTDLLNLGSFIVLIDRGISSISESEC